MIDSEMVFKKEDSLLGARPTKSDWPRRRCTESKKEGGRIVAVSKTSRQLYGVQYLH